MKCGRAVQSCCSWVSSATKTSEWGQTSEKRSETKEKAKGSAKRKQGPPLSVIVPTRLTLGVPRCIEFNPR